MFLEDLCFSDHRLILRGSITCNEEGIISMERVDRTMWDQTLEYFGCAVRYVKVSKSASGSRGRRKFHSYSGHCVVFLDKALYSHSDSE